MTSPYESPTQTPSNGPDHAKSVQNLQIITIALILGVLVFAGIALVLNSAELGTDPDILSWVGIGFAVICIANHQIVPAIMTGSALKNVSADAIRNADEGERFRLLFPIYQTRHIVACALLEGGAFFNIVMYIVTKFVGNLAAAGVLLLFLASRLVMVSSASFWVQDRAREIEMK